MKRVEKRMTHEDRIYEIKQEMTKPKNPNHYTQWTMLYLMMYVQCWQSMTLQEHTHHTAGSGPLPTKSHVLVYCKLSLIEVWGHSARVCFKRYFRGHSKWLTSSLHGWTFIIKLSYSCPDKCTIRWAVEGLCFFRFSCSGYNVKILC